MPSLIFFRFSANVHRLDSTLSHAARPRQWMMMMDLTGVVVATREAEKNNAKGGTIIEDHVIKETTRQMSQACRLRSSEIHSCFQHGRHLPIDQTIESILKGELSPSDIPPFIWSCATNSSSVRIFFIQACRRHTIGY